MNRHIRTSLRSMLILVLAIGPLHVQTVFACPMMGMVMDECCCDDHQFGKDCISSDCEAAVGFSDGPCCDQSVEINVDDDARHDTQIARSLEFRSDTDPPPAIAASFDAIAVPKGRAANAFFRPPDIARPSGSDTYLITQRLRI